MASAEIEQVLQHLDKHRPKERTLEGARRYIEAMLAMEPALADVAVRPVTLAGVPAEELLPEGGDRATTFLYFHGGGYALGSPRAYRPLTTRIARAFAGRVIVLDYRLAPEHPFPAGAEDATRATRALIAELGDPRRVVLGGDSAGGGLALAALLTMRDAGEALPAAAALLSPWVDLEGTGESIVSRAALDPIITREAMTNLALLYVGQGDKKHPLASATHADLRGLPPLLLQTGTRELQLDDAVTFAERARQAGVEIELEIWDEMLHVFQMFPVLPEAHRAIVRVAEFLRAKAASA